MILDRNTRLLALHLGLGNLAPRKVCMRYANACVCENCVEREENPKPARQPKQPWETKAA